MSTPHHPQCNGLVERFKETLKQMLKRMCAERPKDWDYYIEAVLFVFAYSEVPKKSLSFSIFELIHGRAVRGPMATICELWSKKVPSEEVKTTHQYVVDLRNKMEETRALARDALVE